VATAALRKIGRHDLTEIASLKTPPAGIAQVVRACMTIVGQADTTWVAQRTWLKRAARDLVDFDKHACVGNHEYREQVERVVAELPDVETVRRIARGCACLAEWCFAIVAYYRVADELGQGLAQ